MRGSGTPQAASTKFDSIETLSRIRPLTSICALSAGMDLASGGHKSCWGVLSGYKADETAVVRDV